MPSGSALQALSCRSATTPSHPLLGQAPHRAPVGSAEREDALDFQQLRHHTRNALQRLIAHVHLMPGLSDTETGRRLIEEVEQRVCLTARISDALFGLRMEPGRLEDRLAMLGHAVIGLFRTRDQSIRLLVSIQATTPRALHHTLVRVANEMLSNAMRHGLADRREGLVRIEIARIRRGVGPGSERTCGPAIRLRVIDDGAGPNRTAPADAAFADAAPGEGLGMMREIARPFGGTVCLAREGRLTVAELILPMGED